MLMFSSLQVMMALSAHLGSLEAEKQKLRAQVSFTETLCSYILYFLRLFSHSCFYICFSSPYFTLPFFFSSSLCSSSNLPRFFLVILFPSSFLIFSLCLVSSSGASSLSGEPVAEGRAGRCSAAAPEQGAGSGHPGGAEQTPPVHVLLTQIRPGRAATGEEDRMQTQTRRHACLPFFSSQKEAQVTKHQGK